MPDTPLNPDALEAMSRVMNPPAWSLIDRYPEDELVIMTKEAELCKAEKLARAYVAVAQPELLANSKPNQNLEFVNSVEELDQLPVGSVVRGGEDDLVGEKIRFSPYLPHWCTIGEEVEADKRDLLPAAVLYRPEVKP